MPSHPSPSWPTLGQVQKLTDMFEEKSQPQQMPKILKNPVSMPKLNTDLMVHIKTAVGEQAEPPKNPMEQTPPKPVMPLPKATITEDFYEVQTIENASVIGDGGNSVAVARPQCPRTYPNFEHFIV